MHFGYILCLGHFAMIFYLFFTTNGRKKTSSRFMKALETLVLGQLIT